jgi:predicted ATPase
VITEIEIEGFKSLEKVHLNLEALNLFVGANASGKSNFFDALRVLEGIGLGFTIDEVFNGKPRSARSGVWTGVRGGSSEACFVQRLGEASATTAITMKVALRSRESQKLVYSVGMTPKDGMIFSEALESDSTTLFRREHDVVASPNYERSIESLHIEQGQSTLYADDLPWNENYTETLLGLSDTQALMLDPAILRGYGQPSPVRRMGERGENFASLVRTLIADLRLKSAYLSWLRQLTPAELDDVTTLEGAIGEPLFALKEGERNLQAPILSDGTLRFAALTAAFFQPDMPEIITIEEIENSIHPSRLRLLVELLKSQSGGDGPQVFATTHSPVVLAWLEESDYATTFFCKRDEETGASIIKPLSEIPRLVELVKKYSLGELLTEGWMETAL